MTNKQKQYLLGFLGYYSGVVDGQWGTLSQAATVAFQRDHSLRADGIFGTETEKVIRRVIADGNEENWWKEIRHFTREEFRCKCGGKHCDGFPAEPERVLLAVADRIRAHFAAAAVVSSGIRCNDHNAAVGGVVNSRHLSGKAMDFCVVGIGVSEVLTYAKMQPEIRYVYAIDDHYVHMDVA